MVSNMKNIMHRLVLSRRTGIISVFTEGNEVLLYNHSLARWSTNHTPLTISIRNNKRTGPYYFVRFSLGALLARLHMGLYAQWCEVSWGYEIEYLGYEDIAWDAFYR